MSKPKKRKLKAREATSIVNEAKQARVKTTIRLSRDVWLRARTYGLSQGVDLQDLAGEALDSHLKSKGF
jgi:hypothetical protein